MSDRHDLFGEITQALHPGYDRLRFQRKGEWRAGCGAFCWPPPSTPAPRSILRPCRARSSSAGSASPSLPFSSSEPACVTARTPRDIRLMLWFGVVQPGGCWWLVSNFAPWLWTTSYCGRGFLIAMGALWAIEFFINARGIGGGNARRLVDKQIAASRNQVERKL